MAGSSYLRGLLAGASLLLALPSPVEALGVVTRQGTELVCSPALVCTNSANCVVPGDTCLRFASGIVGVCGRERALICVSEVGETCPSSLVSAAFGAVEACIPEELAPCLASPLSCIQDVDDAENIVRFGLGDCDGDEIPNGEEESGQLCVPAPPLDLVADGECEPILACAGDADCEDEERCRLFDLAGHRYCVPMSDGRPILCCQDSRSCPGGGECTIVDEDDAGLCGTPYCPELPFEPRLRCFDGPDGVPVTDPDFGDCDADGTTNLEESNADGRDECVADEPVDPPDAGGVDAGGVDAGGGDAGPADAGAFDGGPPGDGGVEPDAGSERRLVFGGGGGCVCRAAPGPSSGAGGALLVGLALGAALYGRRRRG